jgi:hypothetical protein
MEYLQELIKKIQLETGEPVKEVTLILDVKTQWNSVIGMLDNVLKVRYFYIFGKKLTTYLTN